MEFEGTVFRIMPATNGVSAKGPWERQEVIFDMKSQSQYPRRVAVTFFNKTDEVNRLHEGKLYVVSFDLESREYNGRWYTDVRAWRVQPKEEEVVVVPAAAPAAAAPQSTPMASGFAPMPTEEPAYAQSSSAQEVDDLPF
ncbi:MAG: DUF3127 domain-containing protein [Alistipes sp.]|nr:DUF3127 domain-containing protein [Alistipes sp.]